MGETKNLANENQDKVTELKKVLEAKLAASNAKFPIKNPDFDPRD